MIVMMDLWSKYATDNLEDVLPFHHADYKASSSRRMWRWCRGGAGCRERLSSGSRRDPPESFAVEKVKVKSWQYWHIIKQQEQDIVKKWKWFQTLSYFFREYKPPWTVIAQILIHTCLKMTKMIMIGVMTVMMMAMLKLATEMTHLQWDSSSKSLTNKNLGKKIRLISLLQEKAAHLQLFFVALHSKGFIETSILAPNGHPDQRPIVLNAKNLLN